MSQDPIEVKVSVLPPSSALYVENIVVVPILVKPFDDPTQLPEVYAPPILFAFNINMVHWTLVVLGESPSRLAEFVPGSGITFRPLAGDVVPIISPVKDLSKTQVAVKVFTGDNASRVINHYEISFCLRNPLAPSEDRLIRTSFGGDPSVSVTPDPIEIPSWP